MANEAKDLANLADSTALAAAIIYAQFRIDGDYDSANAAWREKVIPPCIAPEKAIRVIREHADAVP